MQQWGEKMERWAALREFNNTTIGAAQEEQGIPAKQLPLTLNRNFETVLDQVQVSRTVQMKQQPESPHGLECHFNNMKYYQYTPVMNSDQIVNQSLNQEQKEFNLRVNPISEIM
jgi:hypothetical protein